VHRPAEGVGGPERAAQHELLQPVQRPRDPPGELLGRVGVMPRGTRVNSGRSRARSSALTCAVTAGCDIPRSSAARVTEPER
jgi:hypothetical protein